jgi:hypothetical protein
MYVTSPVWHLRKCCPVCEQGSSLILVACPLCSSISVICAEEGSAFLDPNATVVARAVDPDAVRCRGCTQTLLRDFVNATAAQIQTARIPVEDYE